MDRFERTVAKREPSAIDSSTESALNRNAKPWNGALITAVDAARVIACIGVFDHESEIVA